MKNNLKKFGIALSLAAALFLNQGRLFAESGSFSERPGRATEAAVTGKGRTVKIQDPPQAERSLFPAVPIAGSSVNLKSYERKLAEYDAEIARDPDDATLYINKAIFQRMNLDVVGKIHTLEKALRRKNLVTEGSELADMHFDLAILYGPLGIYEKGYYHFLVLHQIDQEYFKKAQTGLGKYTGMINP